MTARSCPSATRRLARALGQKSVCSQRGDPRHRERISASCQPLDRDRAVLLRPGMPVAPAIRDGRSPGPRPEWKTPGVGLIAPPRHHQSRRRQVVQQSVFSCRGAALSKDDQRTRRSTPLRQTPPSPNSAITKLRHHQPPPSPTSAITNLRHHQPPPSPTSAITNPASFQAPLRTPHVRHSGINLVWGIAPGRSRIGQ